MHGHLNVKNINNHQKQFDINDIFYSHNSHQNVAADIMMKSW